MTPLQEIMSIPKKIHVVGFLTVSLFILSCNEQAPAYKKSLAEEFSSKLEHLQIIDELTIATLKSFDTATSEKSYLNMLQETVLPNWVSCVDLMDESKALVKENSSENELRTALKQYAAHRIEEARLLIKKYQERKNYIESLDSVRLLIVEARKEVVEKRNALQ